LKKIPFARLLAALIAGIILQWYFHVSVASAIIIAVAAVCLLVIFTWLPASKKFRFGWARGCLILILFACSGIAVTWMQNIQHHENWYGKFYEPGEMIMATIQEPLIQKTNSYKALADVSAVFQDKKPVKTQGRILLYFRKDSTLSRLKYGKPIFFTKPIQPIQSNGNPAALDYNRYCLFQNITGQVFLSTGDFKISHDDHVNKVQQLLFEIRDWALHVMQKNIHTSKELGIAEALLLGYRNDLDKDLVQAYSNTGVVHIIAISGLHIGVIYGALVTFFSWFKSGKIKRWIEPVVILMVIWMFTLIAGAAPSVLRASVMFTFLIAGSIINKRGNMYNTLAASAFVLLLFNPFYLWDVGFQLSYSAVFSIVLCYKNISGLLFFNNKFLRKIWQLCAISLSAQVFTLPIVIYHFHQLPVLFLFSNLIAVPLSGLVLMEELLLFCFSWWPPLASFIGTVTEISIRLMNDFIEHIDKLPFSVWDGLHISLMQLIMLTIVIGFICAWIFTKHKKYFLASLVCLCLCLVSRDMVSIQQRQQQKLVIYHVPKFSAMDFITGNTAEFAGDTTVIGNAFLRNFNIKPARVKYRVYDHSNILLPCIENRVITVHSKKILMLGNCRIPFYPAKKISLQVLILTKNTSLAPAEISKIFNCDYIVADGSVPEWKSRQWKKQFEQLHLRFFSTAQNGAFTLKL
jgi:competence protein ComEC